MIPFQSRLTSILLLIGAGTIGFSASASTVRTTLDEGFRTVPPAARPWVYWWWLKGNVTEQSITSDLEAMKQNGFGGLLMFDARGYHEDHVVPPPSKMEFMSREWRQMLKFSLAEAHRLGLEVSVNLSSSAGALKGPWPVGDDAPKKLVWTSLEVRGPRRLEIRLPQPEGKRFRDIALMAIRHAQSGAAASEAINGVASFPDHWHDAGASNAQRTAMQVVSLASKNGAVAWNVPEGNWTLLRFACVTMDGHEFDVDILDPKAVEGHFERMGRTLLADAGALAGAGRTLTHFYSVSWEGAAPTWTRSLEKEFKKYRDYELRPWLPVLAGFDVNSRELSQRFLRDYYKTLGDCFRDNFYGTLQTLCGRAGLKWHSESGGPWDRKLAAFEQADQLAFLARNDMPQGEFWWPRRSMNHPIAMTAHIYGKPLAAAEAFTHMVQHWSAYPATLKPRADAAFCDGINHLVWHTFTASPPELGIPGSEYFAGTHINPRVTWWPQAAPFIQYLGRNQFMLRQGSFVADACAYVSDRNYLHWDRGTNWSDKPSLTLPRGYAYDLINTEVLLDRLAVKNGDLVLPDGMSYRMLIVDLDDDAVPPAALRRVVKLAKAGATVVLGARQPRRAPGLTDFPVCDNEVQTLAAELWGQSTASPAPHRFGRGKMITGTSVPDALAAAEIVPDFSGPWDYTHRRSGDADIYLVAGEGSADCVFRVQSKQPELWDAVTGQIQEVTGWRQTSDGRTVVPITLPRNGAMFVVFRKQMQAARIASAPAGILKITSRAALTAQVPTSDKETLTLNGPWSVQFQPGRGAPDHPVVFDQLLAWDKHTDTSIKYFSGKATYRKAFELSEQRAHQLVRLHLGEVRHVAQVRLNGTNLGIVWTDPWSIDLTGVAKAGRNELEIDVINTWVNRLIGDAGLPDEKRITRSNMSLQPGARPFKVYQGFSAEDPLMPSGLLGPVRLEF